MYSYFSFSPKSTSSSPSSTASSYISTCSMEIPATSSSARPISLSASPSCAYPSWPRRSSLSSNNSTSSPPSFEHANSFISDEDLYPLVFDEADTEPNASANTSPSTSRSPSMCEPDQIVGVDHAACAAWMRELIAEEKAKKERERKRRGRSGSGKKSRSSSKQKMSPILEAGE